MCFPTLRQSFCCCSLRTGMYFICWITVLWNLCYFFYENMKESPPVILASLDDQNLIQLSPGHHFVDYSRYYYATQIIVITFALIGISTNSTFCLNPLVVNETVMLLTYVFLTLHYANTSLYEYNSKVYRSHVHPAKLFLFSAIKYYVFLIILSFYSDVSKGGDGRGDSGGVIIATEVASSARSPAPCPNNQTLHSVSYVNSPYATQPPYAPIISQPNEFPQIVIQTDTAPCAPPKSCPISQSIAMNEIPPPYAP